MEAKKLLTGKKGLVAGIANDESIAYGCGRAFYSHGAKLAVTYQNEKGRTYVAPLAAELGPKRIRVHALSPGPLKTRAASGIGHFDELMTMAEKRSPQRRLVDIDDVGAIAAFLVSDFADAITGNTTFIDAGYHIMG
jgi:enoyl-[acyl-carrier protein] reductase I